MDSGIAVIIAAIIAVLGYIVKGKIDTQARERQQREDRYRGMLKAMQGFYTSFEDKQLKQKFLDEMNQAYLYASDDVMRAANEFLDTVKIKPELSVEEEKKSALANLVLAMRRDLKKTKLDASEFETWAPA